MFNCKDGSIAFDDEFLREAQKLSTHPILLVPVSKSGISCGAGGACYWNSNLLIQTFGGQSILGFNIYQRKGFIELMGHANWLTPEGQLLDVTESRETTPSGCHYFLPLSSGIQPQFGSKSEKTLANYIYIEKAWNFRQYLVHGNHVDPGDQIHGFEKLAKDAPIKTLFSLNAVSSNGVRLFLDTLFSTPEMDIATHQEKSEIRALFVSSTVLASPDKVSLREVIDSESLGELICTAGETGRCITETNPEIGLFSVDCFGVSDIRRKLAEYAFDDISRKCQITGRHIWEIRPCSRALADAWNRTDQSYVEANAPLYGMTSEEYALWTSDSYVPHPYLTLKAKNNIRKYNSRPKF